MRMGFIENNEIKTKKLVVDDTFTNAICYGQTGSGKTTAFILPNIENRIKLNHGVLVYDFKGNIHTHIKAIADKYGKLSSVHEIGKPWGKNIDVLKHITNRSLESIFDNISKESNDHDYWEDSAKKLFINLFNIFKNIYFVADKITEFKDISYATIMLTREIQSKYYPNLKNIYSVCQSANKIVEFFKVINGEIDTMYESFDRIIQQNLNIRTKKDLNKMLFYHTEVCKYFNNLGEYHSLEKTGSNSGNNGVLQVLNNILSSVAVKDFLSKDEFDIVSALNRGEIVIINVQNITNDILTLINTSIYEQLTIRTSLGYSPAITIFIDECHRVLSKNSLPDVDVCRENNFEFIMATQDILLLESVIGQMTAYMLLRNVTSQFTFKTTLDDLDKFEYKDLISDRCSVSTPIYLSKKELLEVEYKYQKLKYICDVVDIETDSRYVVQYSPIYEEKNCVLVNYIDKDVIKVAELELNTVLIDKWCSSSVLNDIKIQNKN
jgi:type IV secretory pathway TraG/TraD family ATPase VirD4